MSRFERAEENDIVTSLSHCLNSRFYEIERKEWLAERVKWIMYCQVRS